MTSRRATACLRSARAMLTNHAHSGTRSSSSNQPSSAVWRHTDSCNRCRSSRAKVRPAGSWERASHSAKRSHSSSNSSLLRVSPLPPTPTLVPTRMASPAVTSAAVLRLLPVLPPRTVTATLPLRCFVRLPLPLRFNSRRASPLCPALWVAVAARPTRPSLPRRVGMPSGRRSRPPSTSRLRCRRTNSSSRVARTPWRRFASAIRQSRHRH